MKAENTREDATVEAKKKAVERLQKMQPVKFKYNVVYASKTLINQNKSIQLKNESRA